MSHNFMDIRLPTCVENKTLTAKGYSVFIKYVLAFP